MTIDLDALTAIDVHVHLEHTGGQTETDKHAAAYFKGGASRDPKVMTSAVTIDSTADSQNTPEIDQPSPSIRKGVMTIEIRTLSIWPIPLASVLRTTRAPEPVRL